MAKTSPLTAYVMDISGDHPLVVRILNQKTERISLGEMNQWGIPKCLIRDAARVTSDDCTARNWLCDVYDHLPRADRERAGTALWMVGCSPEWMEDGQREVLRSLMRSAGFGMPVPVCSFHAALAGSEASWASWKETGSMVQVQISAENTVVVWTDRGQNCFRVSPVGAHVLDLMLLAKNLEQQPNGRSTAVMFSYDDDYALELVRRCCFLREKYLYRQPEAVSCQAGNPELRIDEAIMTAAAEDPVVKSLGFCLRDSHLMDDWEELGSDSWMQTVSGFLAGLPLPAGQVPVILTGMTARLDSVVNAVEKAIPSDRIFVDDDPALTVSRGLCRMALELVRCMALQNVCAGFAKAPRQQAILEEIYGQWADEKGETIKEITDCSVDRTLRNWLRYEFEAKDIPHRAGEMLKKAMCAYFSGDRKGTESVLWGFQLREDWEYLHRSLSRKLNDSFRDAMVEAGEVWDKELLDKKTDIPVDVVAEEDQNNIIRALAEDYCIRKGSAIFLKWPQLSIWNPLTMSRRLYFEMLDIFGSAYQRFRREDLEDTHTWVLAYLNQPDLRQKMVERCQSLLQEILHQKQAEWIQEMNLPEDWLQWCGCMPEEI